MKVLVLLFLAGLTSASRIYKNYSIEQADKNFDEFVDKYNKRYADEVEKTKRFEIFKQNLQLINQKNMESSSTVYGISKFCDLTSAEFISRHTGCRGNEFQEPSLCKDGVLNSTSAPDSWDWRDKNVISKVKDQDGCGSCWAFSAIGNVEAYYAIKHNDVLDLSEQQLVDCDTRSKGCDGTKSIEYPFLYLKESSGAMQEKDYPYDSMNGKCKFDASKVKAHVSNCTIFKPKTEEDLKNIVYKFGPVSIGVDASGMQHYNGHVLENCPYTWLNHAVLIVGYGTEDKTAYWLIKNSWGETFGETGYIKIRRGVNACGLMKGSVWLAVVD